MVCLFRKPRLVVQASAPGSPKSSGGLGARHLVWHGANDLEGAAIDGRGLLLGSALGLAAGHDEDRQPPAKNAQRHPPQGRSLMALSAGGCLRGGDPAPARAGRTDDAIIAPGGRRSGGLRVLRSELRGAQDWQLETQNCSGTIDAPRPKKKAPPTGGTRVCNNEN